MRITLLIILAYYGQFIFGQNISFSHKSGFYEDEFKLDIGCDNCEKIYYTIDGSEPNIEDNLYLSPIEIYPELSASNNIAYIPTTARPNISTTHQQAQENKKVVYEKEWKSPNDYTKAIVISARGFSAGKAITTTKRATFFINHPQYSLPIFSIFVEPNAFYDKDTGIYVPGIHCDPENSVWTGNYHQSGKAWERKAAIEFIENGETSFNQNVGLRIHGLKSGSAPQKSLRLYARKKYGSKKILHTFFKDSIDKLKRVILRTPYSAHRSMLITDIIVQEICRPMNIEIMDYEPCLAFVNGEYWGVHILRERMDEEYLKNHYKLKDKNSFLKNWNAIGRLTDSINAKDMANLQDYKYINTQLDIASFIDYIICETYFNNKDWLVNNNNVEFWKKGRNGKWRFLLIDMDNCFQKSQFNMFDFIEANKSTIAGNLFMKLMQNQFFKEKFIKRYSKVVNTHFNYYRVEHIIDSISNLIRPEINRHSDRWKHPETPDDWEDDLEYMKEYARTKPRYTDEHIRTFFGVKESGIDILAIPTRSIGSSFLWALLGTSFVLSTIILFIALRKK